VVSLRASNHRYGHQLAPLVRFSASLRFYSKYNAAFNRKRVLWYSETSSTTLDTLRITLTMKFTASFLTHFEISTHQFFSSSLPFPTKAGFLLPNTIKSTLMIPNHLFDWLFIHDCISRLKITNLCFVVLLFSHPLCATVSVSP